MPARPLAAAVLLAALPAALAQAPVTPPLAVEDLYRLDAPRESALSPDGKTLIYSRAWIDPATKADRTSLWVTDGGPAGTKPLEAGEPDARAPVFSPDGKWIAFLSTRPRPDGGTPTPPVPPYSDPAVDIWLIPAAGGTAVPLVGPKKPYGRVFHDGFYGRLSFSPSGRAIAFIADDGADVRTDAEKANGVVVISEDQGEGYTGYRPAQVWGANLAPDGGAPARLVQRLTRDEVWYGDPQWAPDEKTLVVVANKTADRESARYSINKNFDLWAIDIGTEKQRQLTTNPGPDVSPRFSPDGKHLAYLSVPRKGSHRDVFNLTVLDPTAAEPKPRALFDHHGKEAANPPHRPPSFPLPAACWLGNGELLFNAEAGVHTEMVRVDVASGKAVPRGPLKPEEDTATHPLGRLSLATKLHPHWAANPFLTERQLGKAEVVKWKNEGFDLEGALTVPPEGVAKPPYKLIVYPHGGPHSRTTMGFDFTVQVFAANGYAVFQPNFRGSSGYGQAFIDADRNDFGGGDMRDILSGVDKLIADKVADGNRLFVYGSSYGGYLTTWLVGQTPRFRAAVAQNAVTDLNMMWYLSDIPSWTEWEFGGRPWEVPEKMRKHSPITYADKVTTPTLVLHARDDRRVPLPMGVAYHQALKSRGVPTGLVIYPDEGHGIRQPRHREDVLRRVLGWFAEHGGK